ncbi:putative TetR family transcriptional regulator [Actinacidiphila reveromycinica]|uniref:Putative TetR family transcriptional regulator n=1 Tax=Actinacidiphila reveromycinica TaxID=659352 RepID=A0A7U3URQ5_9ACTN|nr:helix-turn-helix domain-containing protein [Streptomyces sp. SN-593]BBA99135.1 putative TetR family transcriptional regulator [Streptomyces sp. SN-593]
MHLQDSRRTSAADSDRHGGITRPAPLRVDAQRNLEHVLRAAREVFGELGYGAPMEDVARRARVGVGTVYRRFPSKDVLVRRIAKEETARLTEQARTALGQEDEAWSALARFLRTSAASGAGRLLPPQVLRVEGGPGAMEPRPGGDEPVRVPSQRTPVPVGPAGAPDQGLPAGADHTGALPVEHSGPPVGQGRDATESRADDDGVGTLLDVVGQLVERARQAGELRTDVSVADVLLVIATSPPALPDAHQQEAASARLLDILLEGLRPRPGLRRTEHVTEADHHSGADPIE